MKIPRDQIKKIAIIDDNTLITFYVESFEISETAGNPGSKLPAGCKMYKTQVRVLEPPQYADMSLFDNFVVGSADDPLAEDPETWTAMKNFGARRVNEFLNAIGVTSEDDETWPAEASEQQGQALVTVETPEDGKYKGVAQNRVSHYYALGQAPTPTVKTGGAAAAAAAKRVVASAPKPVFAATPPQRVATTPTTTTRPAVRTPAPPPATRTVGRPTGPKAPIVAPKQVNIPCMLCAGDGSVVIPRNVFNDHMLEHAALMQSEGQQAAEE